MKVARQFIAWEIRHHGPAPLGNGLICVMRFVHTRESKDAMLIKSYRTLRELSDFVPEGLDDRSQAIHCLEQDPIKIRPVGHGLILTPR